MIRGLRGVQYLALAMVAKLAFFNLSHVIFLLKNAAGVTSPDGYGGALG